MCCWNPLKNNTKAQRARQATGPARIRGLAASSFLQLWEASGDQSPAPGGETEAQHKAVLPLL